MIKRITTYFYNVFSSSIMDDENRQRILFVGLNILLAVVAFFMTVVNVFTNETVLMFATLTYTVLCLFNLLLLRTKLLPKIIHLLFMVELYILFAFFIISGHPEGFSSLWISMVPCFTLLIFGKKEGTIYSFLQLLILIFFFWLPIGQNFLKYAYTETFKLRFPFFYIAFYIISLFLEIIRSLTQNEFKNSEDKYKHLYRHDALTSLNNRYGFYEELHNAFNNDSIKKCAVIMADIDHFKRINDDYGHQVGDDVLKGIAKVISENVCEHTIVSRWGGEEFLMFLKCGHDPMQVCESIRQKVSEIIFHADDKTFSVTISIGICVANIITENQVDQFIRIADDELYNAKNKGRNLVIIKQFEE